MEIGKQIKKYRTLMKLSQDELAEQIFVTRQSISNWENDKTYPDIHSLVLLSTLFNIPLDTIVKGDLMEMKEQIYACDLKKFNKDGILFCFLLIATIASITPLFLYAGVVGIVLWLILFAITMFYAICLEKQKKAYDVQTYKEILAFMNGKRLDELEKLKEQGKRPYQSAVNAIAVAMIALIIVLLMVILL